MSNGFQSYSTYQATPEENSSTTWNPVRVHDTVNKVSSVDGTVTENVQANAKGHSGELNPYHGTDSIFATARSPNGAPVTEILPTTLVTIGGTQAPVSFFVTEGILQKNADGTYGPTESQPQEAPVADTGDHLPMADTTMAAVNAALAEVPQGNLDSLIASGAGVVTGRLDAASLAQRFGAVSGLGTEESQARVDTIMAAFQSQADEALTTRGGIAPGDLPAFYAWAKANRQGQLQETVQRQMMAHDISGYRAMAEAWLSATPPSINAMKAAGLPVRRQGQGSEVFVRGSWMTPGAAAKSGLI